MKRTLLLLIVSAVCSIQAQDIRRSSSGGAQQPVSRLNKSSTLVGTEVRTRSNERIGEVKDVVLDLNSGRIAYFVVDAAEVLDGDSSLIAVPPFAIQPGSNQRAIVVDADREKIENLRAFSRNNYPAIQSASTRMNRWRSTTPDESARSRGVSARQQQAAQRSPRQATNSDTDWYFYEWYVFTPDYEDSSERADSRHQETGRGAYGQVESSSQYSNEQRRESRPRSQRQPRDRTTGYSDYSGADHGYGSRSSARSGRTDSNTSSRQGSESRSFYGQIKDVHYDNRTLTVENDQQTLRFQLADSSKLRLNNRENARFTHFHEGQWVRIEYREEDGAKKAISITESGYIAPN